MNVGHEDYIEIVKPSSVLSQKSLALPLGFEATVDEDL
jgi:hypothetical protein